MGVLDKIKNALFEVEYVEVEEPVKKEKKPKQKVNSVEKKEKPIAKKIVLPGKKEEKVEELEEEDLKDEDFEIRPKDETRKENNRDEFKFMDDNVKMDDEEYTHEEPEIVKVIDKGEEEYDYRERRTSRVEKKTHRDYLEVQEKEDIDYPDKLYNNSSYNKNNSSKHDSKPYGMDNSYNVSVHEYGTYDKKDERTYFKPSPIISPIYGILDKNYKKEDVVPKKEIRLTTNYTRSNVSVDDIRNKAYGEKEEDKDEFSPRTFELEDDDDDDLLVDLTDDKDKPEVKELTMGDALEYFQDLGLEYNVDYVDASKERATPRRVKDNYDEFTEEKNKELDDIPVNTETIEDEKSKEVAKVVKTTSAVEIKDESKNDDTDVSLDDDDNLFDLIDSMYQEGE